MPNWMNHKLESRCQGEISTTWDMQMIHHPNGRKQRGTKEPLNESKRGEWKSWLKAQHSKNSDHGIGPIISWQIDEEKMETVTDFIFLGSKITVDGDCSHEVKKHLLHGRKAMTNLDSILKSRDVTLPTKVYIVKAMVFFSSHVWMWELVHKGSWAPKKWCFQTVVLEKTLESPLDSKEIKPVNSKGHQPWIFIRRTDAEAETPILRPFDVKSWLTGKDPDAGEDWRREEKGMTEDEMVGWHQFNRHEFEWTPGDGEGQESLVIAFWGVAKRQDLATEE